MWRLDSSPASSRPSGWWGVLKARFRARHQRDRQSGVAFLITISSLSLLIALVGQFTFNTTVDAAQAVNARDEVRAHYLARSAVSLSRLLIRIQLQFVEDVMDKAQSMMNSQMGQDLGISLRATDYITSSANCS
jgi:hypothetical protein